MTLTERHHKHANLTPPDLGVYGRNEFSILGAPCDKINEFADNLAQRLFGRMTCCFIDADHSSFENQDPSPIMSYYRDHKRYHNLQFQNPKNEYEQRFLLSGNDLILVNGNHFHARQQIVLVTEEKRESLSKKLAHLTNVSCFVLGEGESRIHSFLSGVHKSQPIFNWTEIAALSDFIYNTWLDNLSMPCGLILGGGKSIRMGQAKLLQDYRGKSQWSYLKSIMPAQKMELFLSIASEEQFPELNSEHLIADRFLNLGPLGGILSAFCKNPNTAWLTVACDMPLLRKEHLELLLRERNPSKLATCFHNPETGFPEPLLTIWEPKAYPVILQFLSMGLSCPRKVLINSEVKMIETDDTRFLKNANTPEERDSLVKLIGN